MPFRLALRGALKYSIARIGRTLLLIMPLALLSGGCNKAPEVVFSSAPDSQFRAGQIWLYRTRPGDESSFLIVTGVDGVRQDGEVVTVVHVLVDNLAIEHPQGGQLTQIRHIALTEIALLMSVIANTGLAEPPPDNQSAYEGWREAFEKGDAEVLNITVAEAVEAVVVSLGS